MGSYSLWLMPRGISKVQLQKEIDVQARQYNAPRFAPHVTLLGGIGGEEDAIAAKTAELAGSIQKFRINLLDVSTGPSFHRCVYFLAAKDPAIMAAGQAARDTFGMTGDDYMPHCSLLYADLAPEDKGRAAAAAVQRLFGEGSDYSTLLLEAGFTAESITLWYTPADDLQLASWKQLAEFELQ